MSKTDITFGEWAKRHWFVTLVVSIALLISGWQLLLHLSDEWAILATTVTILLVGMSAAVIRPMRPTVSQRRRVAFRTIALLGVLVCLTVNVVAGIMRHSREAPARAIAATEQAHRQAIMDQENEKLFKIKKEIYNHLASAGLNQNGWQIDSGSLWTQYEEMKVFFNSSGEPESAEVKLKVRGTSNNEGTTFVVKKGKDGFWRAGCPRIGGGWIAFDERISPVDSLIVEQVVQESACPASLPAA